jgi:sialate O-acetylesterase
MFAEAIIENGAWEITFGARMEASAEMGHTMKIYADGVSYEFTDVLVGDVYMVMGQSNCAYTVHNHHLYVNTPDKGGKDVLDYNAPIRIHYNTQMQTQGYPKWGTEEVCLEVKSGSTWQRADSYEDIASFTAIGYLFAHNYVKLTDSKVPIGLIEIDGNGRPLGAFMCNQVATEKGTDRYDAAKGYYVTTGVNGDAGRFLYNQFMYPFERYALAGIIWYQGESDLLQANARVYTENFSALMTYMRGTHNLVNKDFPVYYVEFPTIYQKPANHVGDWHYMDVGMIRAVMGEIQRVLPNSHQIVSTDLWSDDTFFNNLHPNCKFEQSQRIATLAAAINGEAGKTVEQGNGPILVSMEILEGGKKAILTYENVGEGLKTTDGGTTVKGFAMYRKNVSLNSKAELTATITAPNQITIESNSTISGIPYNCITYNVYGVDFNLCNSEGVPAGATVMLKDAE